METKTDGDTAEQTKVINQLISDEYALYNGDSCQIVKGIPSDSIDYSIFSPPFSSLFTYNNSKNCLGNSKDDETFFQHFKFLVLEMYRITKPGRLLSFHCMNLPTLKSRDGFVGLKDFRGDLIRLFVECGFIYSSETLVWKDPLISAVRTKALGLMHKQVLKDSNMSRSAIPDYLVTMRKPGENAEPINGCFNTYTGEDDEPEQEYTGNFDRMNTYSHNVFRRYASPVWMDIRQGVTLNAKSARNEDDSKHLCPLQLDVIDRALELWTNKGDVVFSPFMGIGSEGYCALRMERKFIGIELKEDYFRESVQNIKNYKTDLTEKKAKVKRKKLAPGESPDKEHSVNTAPLSKSLPTTEKQELPSSNIRVKVFGTVDTIENHFAKIHESESASPTCYKDLAEFSGQTCWKVSASKRLGLNEHKSPLNFGQQFYILMWYKFVLEQSNIGFINIIKEKGLPEVFKVDPEMGAVDIMSMLDDKAAMLGAAQELNAILKASK